MKEYTLYDQSGLIRATMILLNDEEADLNAGENLSWISGTFSPDKYCIKNKEPVLIPEKPDYPCYFDATTMQWVWYENVSWSLLRKERNRRLAACDWTQVADAPVDHQAWAVYRQQLRDLPDNTQDPRYPVWPTPPA